MERQHIQEQKQPAIQQCNTSTQQKISEDMIIEPGNKENESKEKENTNQLHHLPENNQQPDSEITSTQQPDTDSRIQNDTTVAQHTDIPISEWMTMKQQQTEKTIIMMIMIVLTVIAPKQL